MTSPISPASATLPSSVASSPDSRSNFRLDGREPDHLIVPESEDAAVESVQWASAEGFALVPWGGGRAVEQGNTLRAAKWAALSTAGLTRLIEFSADDMVVTAEAGLSLSALQQALAKEKQFLPVDAPFPEVATLGGIVATNAQGLWRPMFGTPRDRLLGVRVVMADGSVVRGGGKVVKNVAGYDLCKMFAGSWGTLGLITEVTFKTNPLPETQAQAIFSADDVGSLVEAALQIHAARLQPVHLTAVSTHRPALYVGLLGSAQAVAWQSERIADVLINAGLQRTEEGLTPDALRELAATSESPLTAHCTVRPSELPEMAAALNSLADTAIYYVPTGVVEVTAGANRTESDQRTLFDCIRTAVPAGGHLVWSRLPAAWKSEVDVWGPTRGDFPLMRALKSALDPSGLFSPGRFVGRL